MPELPEVETVRRGLAPVLTRRRIVAADIRREGLRRPFPPGLAERLQGVRVLALGRRSKYLLAELDSGETLILHLGMSGRIILRRPEGAARPGGFHHDPAGGDRHDHVVIVLEDGMSVVFNDPRRFGVIDLAATVGLEAHPLLAAIGPEPLGNRFDGAYLRAALAARRGPVKTALLDQKLVAGIGNIYACEALHAAGISPRRRADRIAAVRVERCVRAIRETLAAAIDSGGSTLRDYRRADGEIGGYQSHFRVYDKEGKACRTPDCVGIIARITQAGRSTYYCPRCQR